MWGCGPGKAGLYSLNREMIVQSENGSSGMVNVDRCLALGFREIAVLFQLFKIGFRFSL